MENILIVDDEEINANIITQILEMQGLNHNYIIATNGKEGLDILTNQKVDLVIMDHRMPVMSGIEALIEMRKFSQEVPIFMTSGGCSFCQSKDCLKHQASGFLTKPFNIHDLIATVSATTE